MEQQKKSKLWVLIGIPASGKSSWIQEHISFFDEPEKVKVVSRDNIRFSLVKEDESYFSKEKEVYETFIKEIKEGLENKNEVIADATHLTPISRSKLFRSLGTSLKDVKVIGVVIDTPLKVALERNAERSGREFVPETAICNMKKSFMIPDLEEGFDRIYIYKYANNSVRVID